MHLNTPVREVILAVVLIVTVFGMIMNRRRVRGLRAVGHPTPTSLKVSLVASVFTVAAGVLLAVVLLVPDH